MEHGALLGGDERHVVAFDFDLFGGLVPTQALRSVLFPGAPDLAWFDFTGWRVNYDVPLLALAGFVMVPYAPWSSDRSLRFRRARLRAGRRR